jgi:hypothetical protein
LLLVIHVNVGLMGWQSGSVCATFGPDFDTAVAHHLWSCGVVRRFPMAQVWLYVRSGCLKHMNGTRWEESASEQVRQAHSVSKRE